MSCWIPSPRRPAMLSLPAVAGAMELCREEMDRGSPRHRNAVNGQERAQCSAIQLAY